ncbi:hypothetical protein RRG08_007025 [Elysia crispata]|uniref:Uncharacterized protein n=1 Tax=Elysia crispata TaxID=231223 RepID=A0AAE1DHY0_9GAST|nr:hypothetical protein RRG08_007025 [Elysia crispata]
MKQEFHSCLNLRHQRGSVLLSRDTGSVSSLVITWTNPSDAVVGNGWGRLVYRNFLFWPGAGLQLLAVTLSR